jgi:hypothetical protein
MIAMVTIVAIITIIALVSSPVIITPAPASAASPAFGIGANSDFKIKVTGHITEHVTPDIIHEVEFAVSVMVPAPTVPVVTVIPGHIPRASG